MTISFAKGRVVALKTTSRYYRTRNGIRVGVLFARSEARWRDFNFVEHCQWLVGGAGLQSIFMPLRQGRIASIEFGRLERFGCI